MILTDDEYAALQTLQQRMLDEALEQGDAPAFGDAALAAIAARLGVLTQIDTVLGASAVALHDDETGDEDAEGTDDDADVSDDEPIEAARRLSRE
jgi:hypothetical protein